MTDLKEGAVVINGIVVRVATLAHLDAHENLKKILSEILEKVSGVQKDLFADKDVEFRSCIVVDMGKTIGHADMVSVQNVSLDTPIYFACRKGRKQPSPVVTQDTLGEELHTATLCLEKLSDGTLSLVTAWPGGTLCDNFSEDGVLEPLDKKVNTVDLLRVSLDEWMGLAFIYNKQTAENFKEQPRLLTWRKVLRTAAKDHLLRQ